jgi:phospholipase C
MRLSCFFALLLASPISAWGAPAFKHVVIVFQENRTPDNLFGSNPSFEPGVDIATSGLNAQGQTVPLTAEPLDYCYDVGHSHGSFVAMYDGGKMDGDDKNSIGFSGSCNVPVNPQFTYVDNSTGTVQPYFDIATQYGFANRMFQTNQGPSFPAHQFIFGGTSAPTATSPLFASSNNANSPPAGASTGNVNDVGCAAANGQRVFVVDPTGAESNFAPVYPCFNRATMADLLDKAGISWKYYLNTNNLGSIWNAPAAIAGICKAAPQDGTKICAGPEYVSNVISTQAQVLTDISNCNLPGVSWVIPNGADSDHANGNKGTGPAWVASIVNAVGNQPACASGEHYWGDTVIFITWDDWGGWYDHVPPFMADGAGKNWGRGYTYGFRVPLLVVSAYTPAGIVSNANHDFGSILQFVESNFGLGKIGSGYYADFWANPITEFFGLSSARGFVTIPAKVDARYFLHVKRSAAAVDDD